MGFTRRCTIVVQSSQVTGTLTDFPVLISKTDNDLKTTGNGGSITSSSGYDIRVFSDSALTVAIPFELVFYDGSAGTVKMWAKIASLATSSTYYLGVGDASLTTDGSSTSTWRSEYKGVWHGVTLNDSTSNGNTLTFAGSGSSSNAAGKIVGAFSFNGSGWATAGDQSSLDIAGGVCSWSHWLSQGTSINCFSMNKQPSAGGNGYEFLVGGGSTSGALVPRITANGNGYQPSSATGMQTGFHLSHGVISNIANNVAMYVDGSLNGSGTNITIGTLASTAEFQIGARGGSNRLTGSVEEMRVFEGSLTADWVSAEYKSQNAPASFASYTFDAAPASSSIIPVLLNQYRRRR